MRHRRNDLGDKPWVTIAAVVGVIAVVIIALVFFWGGSAGQTSGASSSGSSSSGSSSAVPQTTLLSNKGVASITVKQTTAVTVPATGAFVEVNYLGSYSGTYGTKGAMEKAQNSGDRLYTLENANGTISATFQKLDRSTTHDLTVQIWKDGKAVKFADNRSAFGIVSIEYP